MRMLRGLAIAWMGCTVAALAPLAPTDAPGAPGQKATWTNGNKQGIGTSATIESKVWFTLGDGILTEAYYPAVDKANLRALEFVVADDHGFFEQESTGSEHRVEPVARDVLAFRQTNTSLSGRYRLTKTVFTDPRRNAIVVRVRFEPRVAGLRLYAFIDPALNNSGLQDAARAEGDALVASEGDIALAVMSSSGWGEENAGYFGTSDGLDAVRRAGHIAPAYTRATNGNVAFLAEVKRATTADAFAFDLVIGFGSSESSATAEARAALAGPLDATFQAYADGWKKYVSGLQRVDDRYMDQYAMSAMVLAAHEDKTHRGAMVASLTVPWGDRMDASKGDVGGYHLVWSRDLYHVATAFIAMGDRAAANRALNYLFNVQQKPDGSFPQNSWLDGKPFWGSLQLDEVAYPLVLAWQLGRTDAASWKAHVRPAAEFIVARGPSTPQERWEEEGGYSPSTIAAEIAGLIAAAAIADANGEAASASRYRATADEWARDVTRWTLTRTGPYAPPPYFVRLTAAGEPDRGDPLELNNGAGTWDERAIVDAGFLELVRLGITPADAPEITASLRVVDRQIRVETPNGPGWYRYNHDGYGEEPDGTGWTAIGGTGRLWPLLTGERGEYEIAAGHDAVPYLDALRKFANEGLMLPEQVWDRPERPRPYLQFGEGTGSATPLAWTNAQFIRLAIGIRDRRVVEMPDVVREHFHGRP
jgi:glucoamylase